MKYRPWLPVKVVATSDLIGPGDITELQARCLQLLNEGNAGPDEQKIALQAIMWICGIDDMEYLPIEHGGERDSAFKSGKRFVALQIRRLMNVPLTKLIGEKHGR